MEKKFKNLTEILNSERKIDVTVTNSNKQKIINEINSHYREYSMDKLSKNASVKEVREARNTYHEKLTKDILVISINEGNSIIADVYGRGYTKSKDKELSKLSKYGESLAKAKHESNKHLNPGEKGVIESGNTGVLGYGNNDMVTLAMKTRTNKQIQELISTVSSQNPKAVFYDKNIETFNRVFQKIEGVREEDLNKLKNHLYTLGFNGVLDEVNYLLKSLEMYGSPDNKVGKHGDEETDLANARLDDVMIKLGLKKTGKRKAHKILETKGIKPKTKSEE